MSQSSRDPSTNQELLPNFYDELLSPERLIHGEYNPRCVQPKQELKQSIAGYGISDPLIVRPDSEKDVYHITDGWQRYQAAVELGWERLPVAIYDDPLAALTDTEPKSIVREWNTYDWANFCRSLADVVEIEGDSKIAVARAVKEHTETSKSVDTIRRYIDVLSLPEEVHILLSDGPEGSDDQWASLKNFNEDVRQYSDLQWEVADRIARNQSELSETRVIEIAATAVEFETVDEAIEFVSLAIENPEMRIEEVRRKALLGQDYDQYLVAPRVPMKMAPEEKQAIMEHCKLHRQSLADIVSDRIRSLAEDCTTDESDESSKKTDSDEQNETQARLSG